MKGKIDVGQQNNESAPVSWHHKEIDQTHRYQVDK